MVSENDEQFLARIYQRYPLLKLIDAAIEAYQNGSQVTVRCPTCGNKLDVTDFPEIGSLWVSCKTGCTSYHQRYNPQS